MGIGEIVRKQERENRRLERYAKWRLAHPEEALQQDNDQIRHDLFYKQFKGLSTYTRNILARAGRPLLDEVRLMSDERLLKMRCMGVKRLAEIRALTGQQSELWQVKESETTDNWLELEDPEGWYTAQVRWDGCVHFRRYFNVPLSLRTAQDQEDDPDYIHICDVDDLIARLQALKDSACAFFKGKSGEEYWH